MSLPTQSSPKRRCRSQVRDNVKSYSRIASKRLRLKSLIARTQIVSLLALVLVTTMVKGEDTHRELVGSGVDVWEAMPPANGDGMPVSVRAFLLDDDDVLLDFEYRWADGRRDSHMFSMFRGRRVNLSASDIEKGKVSFGDGTTAEIVGRPKNRISFPDGSSIGTLDYEYRRCYRGPAKFMLGRYDPKGNLVQRAVIFKLLDEPKRFVGGGGSRWMQEEDGSCPGEPPLDLSVRVEAITGPLLPLQDGTFLMVAKDLPLVLRFDVNLTTKSRLSGRLIFPFFVDANDDSLFVGSLTHKDYGSLEEGTVNYQQALDDLVSTLEAMRK